ncbi:MAG: HEAT repeat domain-containing protein [Spirochaetales bacterium]|nr:HEAT repeat domain-containing protein [Spirochaetales bacterium]
MKGTLIFLSLSVLLAVLSFPLAAEDSEEEEDALQSITQERRDILLYGIDSQIIAVLEDLKNDKNDSLVEEAKELFLSTLNHKIRQAVLGYFEEISYMDAADTVLTFLKPYEDELYPVDVISASLSYLSKSTLVSDKEALSLFMDLSRHEDPLVQRAAVTALGKTANDEATQFLMELYEDEDADVNLQSIILSSLGELKAREARVMLENILADQDEEKSLRWRACQALGVLGDEKSLPVLKRALTSDDTYLRSYAAAALKTFPGREVESLLMEALKDSFWRVRLSASETLGERKSREAVPILIFKAEKDPEANVRLAAFQALGEIASPEAVDFIEATLEKKTASLPLRQEAVAILLKLEPSGSLELLEKILQEVWEEKNSPLLNTLGKQLSQHEHKDLEPIFAKMLAHPEITMKIYAIRGIGRNRFVSFKESLENLSAPGNPSSIRREALGVLETF